VSEDVLVIRFSLAVLMVRSALGVGLRAMG
jgi:hypothetical protein